MFVSLKCIAKAVVSSIWVKAAAFITIWKCSTKIFRSRGAQIFLGCIFFKSNKVLSFCLFDVIVMTKLMAHILLHTRDPYMAIEVPCVPFYFALSIFISQNRKLLDLDIFKY